MYSSAAGAFVVTEQLNTAWRRLGQHGGTLGFPASDELPCHQGGRYQRFGNGMIVWHPSIGAFAVQGSILAKYTALGGSAWGYPITDETSTKEGWFNHFRSVDTGAEAVDLRHPADRHRRHSRADPGQVGGDGLGTQPARLPHHRRAVHRCRPARPLHRLPARPHRLPPQPRHPRHLRPDQHPLRRTRRRRLGVPDHRRHHLERRRSVPASAAPVHRRRTQHLLAPHDRRPRDPRQPSAGSGRSSAGRKVTSASRPGRRNPSPSRTPTTAAPPNDSRAAGSSCNPNGAATPAR